MPRSLVHQPLPRPRPSRPTFTGLPMAATPSLTLTSTSCCQIQLPSWPKLPHLQTERGEEKIKTGSRFSPGEADTASSKEVWMISSPSPVAVTTSHLALWSAHSRHPPHCPLYPFLCFAFFQAEGRLREGEGKKSPQSGAAEAGDPESQTPLLSSWRGCLVGRRGSQAQLS